MVAVKEMATIFAGSLALAVSFYTYFVIPSIYFPSKDCIMTHLLYHLFILPIFHFIHFIAYLYRFFTNRDCQSLNHIVTKATCYIFIALCVHRAFIYIFPSPQPPLLFEPSIISPAVTGYLKNSDVCRNLANSPDSFSTFQHPILRYDVWDLEIKDHDQLYGTETGDMAFRCMVVYVENIRKASELAAWASIPFEAIVILIIIFLMPVKRATRAVIAS